MASGTLFDLDEPRPEMVKLDDLVHHLSRLGALGENIQFASYSVAQHCLVMAAACDLPEARPYALLGYASRAYIGGMVNGMQLWQQKYGADVMALEGKILVEAILPALRMPRPTPRISVDVHNAHQIACATELRDVVAGRHPLWSAPAKPLNSVIRFKPQPKIEEEYRAALDRELRTFRARAVA